MLCPWDKDHKSVYPGNPFATLAGVGDTHVVLLADLNGLLERTGTSSESPSTAISSTLSETQFLSHILPYSVGKLRASGGLLKGAQNGFARPGQRPLLSRAVPSEVTSSGCGIDEVNSPIQPTGRSSPFRRPAVVAADSDLSSSGAPVRTSWVGESGPHEPALPSTRPSEPSGRRPFFYTNSRRPC